jgi:hypothetical protein
MGSPAAKPYFRWAAPSATPISIILRRFAAATGYKGGCFFSHEVALYSKYRWAAPYFYDNNLTLLTLFRWAQPAAKPYLRWAAPAAAPIATILRRFAAAIGGKRVCFFSHEVALYSKHRVQPCAMRYDAMRYNAMRYVAIRCDAMRYVTLRCNTMRYDTLQNDMF